METSSPGPEAGRAGPQPPAPGPAGGGGEMIAIPRDADRDEWTTCDMATMLVRDGGQPHSNVSSRCRSARPTTPAPHQRRHRRSGVAGRVQSRPVAGQLAVAVRDPRRISPPGCRRPRAGVLRRRSTRQRFLIDHSDMPVL